METPNLAAVNDKIAQMPPEKRSVKLWRTAIGVLIIAFGWGAKDHWPGLPDLVAYGTVVFGGVCVSSELVAYPLKLFLAGLKDLHDAVKG